MANRRRPLLFLLLLLLPLPTRVAAEDTGLSTAQEQALEEAQRLAGLATALVARETLPGDDHLLEAETLATQALAKAVHAVGKEHAGLVGPLQALAAVHEASTAGRPRVLDIDRALRLHERALALLPSGRRDERVRSLLAQGRLYRVIQRFEEASAPFHEAAEVLAGSDPVPAEQLEQALIDALDAYDQAGMSPALMEQRWKLADVVRPLLIAAREGSPASHRAQHLLGHCLWGNLARSAEATAAFERAIAGLGQASEPDKLALGRAHLYLALHRWACGDLASFAAPLAVGRELLEAQGYRFVNDSGEHPVLLFAASAREHLLGVLAKDTTLRVDGLPGRLSDLRAAGSAWERLAGGIGRPPCFAAVARVLVSRAAQGKGADSLAHADALAFAGKVVYAFGAFDEAAQHFRSALAIRRKRLKKSDPLVAVSAGDLGLTLYTARRFTEARVAFQSARELRERKGSLENQDLLIDLLMEGRCALREADFQRAHEVTDRVLGALHKDASFSKWLDADLQFEGDFGRACWTMCAALGRRADLAFLRERFARNEMLSALTSPGEALRAAGRYGDALALLRDPAADVTPTDSGGAAGPPGYARALVQVRLSEALLDLGCDEEAFSAVDDAVRAFAAITLGNRALLPHLLFADLRACTQLAAALLQRGLVPEARAIAARAHALERAIPAWLAPSAAEYISAWGADKRYLPAWRPADHRVRQTLVRATAAQMHARCQEADDDAEAAIDTLTAAVAHVTRYLGDTHPRRAELLHALGSAWLRSGAPTQARPHVERALEILVRSGASDHPSLVPVLLTLGDIELLEEHPAEARAAYERALAIAEEALFPSHMSHVRARAGLALALSLAGQHEEALLFMRAAIGAFVQRVEGGTIGASNTDRLSLVASAHWVLANWLVVSREAGIDGYAEVLRLRGIAARRLAAEQRALLRAPPKTVAIQEELRAAQRQLAVLVHARVERGWQRLAWRRDVAVLTQSCADLTRKLGKAARSLLEEQRGLAAGPEEVAARLDEGEALVDVVKSGGRYSAWILARKTAPIRLELGDAGAIDGHLDAFRKAAMNAERPDDADYLGCGEKVREVLWDPIAAALPPGTAALYLVPDGPVAAAPLGALPLAAEGEVLGSRFVLAHLGYAQQLLKAPGRPKSPRGLLVVGNVDYENGAREGAPARTVVTGRRLADLPHGTGKFGALPATALEAKSVIAKVRASSRKGKIVHLEGAQATEGRIRLAVPGMAILHLATHGQIRDDVYAGLYPPAGMRFLLQPGLELHVQRFDPFLMSGIVLAGANTRIREDEDDGILTALEAIQLDLGATELVTLSACETARGIEQAGEGAIGLVRGFMLAGARNVVGSLWKVGDDATRLLMEQFYARFLKNRTTPAAEALQAAALEMRSGRLGPEAQLPMNWSAFVAYGPLR